MHITPDTRETAFQNATPRQQQLCSAPEIGTALLQLAEEFGVTDRATYERIALCFGDYVLGLLDRDHLLVTLSHELTQDADTAIKLVQRFESLKETPISSVSTKPDLTDEIAETEASLRSITPSQQQPEPVATASQQPPPATSRATPPPNLPTAPETEEPTHFSNQADLLDFDPAPTTKRPPPVS